MMTIILLFFLGITIVAIWFGTWAALRIFRPGLNVEVANRIILSVFAGVFLLVVAEQMFLAFVVNPALVRSDDEFHAVIEIAKTRPGGLSGGTSLNHCEHRNAFYIYNYNICLIGGFKDKIGGINLIDVYLKYPNAYLSIIPQDWTNTLQPSNSTHLLSIDTQGKIYNDLRSVK